MGTTIRRQPIITNIPASPDYKFLNITNFGGMSVSSNPFVVSSNTASDCLNVYVDEDNALSTRPRLQKKYDLVQLLSVSSDFKVIGVYNLHDGYLLHGVDGDVYSMYKFVEDADGLHAPNQITGEIPKNRCKIFEQNDVIYVLDGVKYRNIKENVISDVEGYVPTITVAKTNTTTGTPFESLNLLTNSYKESYIWDASWNLSEIVSNESQITNGYVESISELHNHDIRRIYRNGSNDDDNLYFLVHETGNWLIYKYTISTDKWTSSSIVMPSQLTKRGIIQMDCSADGSVFVLRRYSSDDPNNDGIYVRRNNTWTKLPTDGYTFTTTDNSETAKHIRISADGKVILAVTNDVCDKSTPINILIFEYTDLDEYARRVVSYSHDRYSYAYHQVNWLDISTDGSLGFIMSTPKSSNPTTISSGATSVVYFSTYNDEDTFDITDDKNTLAHAAFGGIYDIASDGIRAAVTYYGGEIQLRYYENVSSVNFDNTNDVYSVLHAKDFNGNSVPTIQPVFYNNRLFVNEGYFDINDLSYVRLIYGDNRVPEQGPSSDGVYYWYTKYAQQARFVDSEFMCFNYASARLDVVAILTRNLLHINKLSFDSTEPLLIITSKIQSTNQDYSDYLDRISKFNTASLIQRFDNNTWFASGNHTFHTLYNDPTYIPLSSYNDLGEDYEDITGLSIVNDEILAAYKRNRIYIITPVTVADQYTYSYTETKNVVGNDVVDAPILTILTEMPVQVSYDGIYALNQLENVQSSDRITTLISEDINPRWLKETKIDIDASQTLNRLYWTYFILPHKKTNNKDTDHTRIYLLDNRSASWFYWELPILNLDSMVKNNKTHLIDVNGMVYTLETSDVLNEYNPDVTEYYDGVNDEKMIIPWHWYSQILSLSTINYSKKLIDTTFILTDTDTTDEYALDYSFIAYRKSVSATNATTISNKINYVQSTTKRTMIPRFNFVQLRLNNTEDDLDNNKLRLVGLGLKYVLLEGLY